ncbi:MAG: amino acid ABC transporter permease [Erysipelotrichaceae bacterium]|nr:amino acid ABC transporter permease [Erysipelotrichaceae bacterium]MDD4642270.1 amino acid ABC transporter permease [Erysipelotrichaceae bacterium]
MTNPYVNGLQTTLQLFVVPLIGSSLLTFILVYLMQNKWFVWLIKAYVYVMRATPLLLQIIFIFYGLPFFNIVLDRWFAAYLAFILNYAAYFVEIVRGGIQSLDKGQKEAGKILQLSDLFIFQKILLPQSIINTFPSISNEILTLVKDTALISVVGLSDLLKISRSLVNATATFVPFITVGIIYLVMNMLLSILLSYIENNLLKQKGIENVN